MDSALLSNIREVVWMEQELKEKAVEIEAAEVNIL